MRVLFQIPGRLVLFSVVFLLAGHLSAQGFLKTDGQKIVNEQGENVLLRGIGLGGWMLQEGYMLHILKDGQQYRIRQRIQDIIGEKRTQEFYTAWLSNHTTRSDMDSLHAWGFNSVRLPMHYNLFTLSADQEPVPGENTWLPTGFMLTDSLIAWCKANHMYVILDLHAAPGGQGNDVNISDRDPAKPSIWQSGANRKKTIALWHKLAERYAGEPTVGGYDLLNEPNWGFEDTATDRNGIREQQNIPLKDLLMAITKSIREVDKKHIIIIEGNGWGNNYNGMLGPWDSNMVLSFHKYWNYNDIASIQHILDTRAKYNVPVWLGETGENSNVWFTDAIRLLESQNIGWSWWPLKKLGYNNPLQIRSVPGYSELADFFNEKTSTAPPADSVYRSLMELAFQTKCERNTVRWDVIDAMMRQTRQRTAIPFRTNIISDGTTIQAEDFDLGPNGIAYYDLDTANFWVATGEHSMGNNGGVYRNDGVDIYKNKIAQGGYYVGKTEKNEWLQYSLSLPRAAKFNISFRVASESEAAISIYNPESGFMSKIKIPATGGGETWQSVTLNKVPFISGTNHLLVIIEQGGFNLDEISFSR